MSFPTLTNLREKSHKISSVYVEMLLNKIQNSFQIKEKKKNFKAIYKNFLNYMNGIWSNFQQ